MLTTVQAIPHPFLSQRAGGRTCPLTHCKSPTSRAPHGRSPRAAPPAAATAAPAAVTTTEAAAEREAERGGGGGGT
jgi:hypothetical protein